MNGVTGRQIYCWNAEREAEAKEILHQLMQQRGFYPMVAAQRIGEEYELKIDKAPQNVDSALTQGPEMARVRELMYWNLDNTARSEWANLVKSKSKNRASSTGAVCFQPPMVGS
ncbi:murein transglycosylase [Escherichia coli]|uniref:Murein transglycosylase n=1 Tax=Escherichia coli TaxID=562 RepID=A0A377DEJ9_ECOLX|nr:murein transglycosylase [Escherichia coli]